MVLNEIRTMIQVSPKSRKEKAEIQVLQKKKKALLALTNAEQSMDVPKPIYTKEKDLNFLIKGIINAVKESKTEKPLLALTDAKPSMNIRKTLFKKDSEALLRQLIKSTTIPKQEKEKVMLALTNTPHSSNKVINIIENHLGHKVTDIITFYHKLIQYKQHIRKVELRVQQKML